MTNPSRSQTRALVDYQSLRAKAVEALAVSDPEWTYIDGPTLGDICVETRPKNPGRTRIRLDGNAIGPYIAAASPSVVVGLIDALAAMTAARDDWRRRAVAHGCDAQKGDPDCG
jgi:hypothetical protein